MIKRNYLIYLCLASVLLFSIGKTSQYYFFTDDYPFLYYLRTNHEFGWPYHSVLPFFRPIFNIFQINPIPYFALAIVTYFFASISVYFFVKKLIQNKLIAFLSSMIFATAYIGVDQFSMIAVSIVNNLNVINVCITLMLLVHFLETGKITYYFLTLLMFSFSIMLFPYRAYPLILFLPTVEIIRNFRFYKIANPVKNAYSFILRYIPFILVGALFGIFSYGTFKGNSGQLNLFSLLTDSNSKVFALFSTQFLKELFAILGKFIVVKPTFIFFGFVPDQSIFFLAGLIAFIALIIISIFLIFKKNAKTARNLLIVLFLTIEAYVGNMFLNIDFDSNGPVNRYLTIAFVFFSALVPLFFFILFDSIKIKWLNKNLATIIVVSIVVVSFTNLSREYEDFVVEERSKPAKSFFKQLKTFVPNLSDANYNVFYFDRASYYPIPSRFGNTLLSAAVENNVNLALPYGVSVESVKIVDTFDDFMRYVSNPKPHKKNLYYAFYNDEKGLHNTTEKVFLLLKEGSYNKPNDSQIKYSYNLNIPTVSIKPSKVSSLTPLKISLRMKISPLSFENFKFPYISSENSSGAIEKEKKLEIFSYLLSRQKYYKTVRADVESIHIGKKNTASFLVDDNVDTYWLSDQSRWEVKIKPWIKIDLSEERQISRVIWKELANREIKDFTLQYSLDGSSWRKIADIKKNKIFKDGYFSISNFDEVKARYILLTINSLSADFSPGPGLTEIEVVESSFSDIDFESAMNIIDFPFAEVRDRNELEKIYEYLYQNANLSIKTFTNKDDPSSTLTPYKLPIFVDGQLHEYEFRIPPGGTILKEIKLGTNFPSDIFVESVVIENQSQDVLKREVKEKCKRFKQVVTWANPFECI